MAALTALWLLSPAFGQQQALPLVLPGAAEVAQLPAETRLREQVALKKLWLERLIRAREERNRVTRENLAQSLLLAQKLEAPAPMVEILRRLVSGSLPYRDRHALETARQELFTAYGVDAREMRFFVEGSGLSAEQLRDVVAWLPLPALFNLAPAAAQEPAPDLGQCYRQLLSALRELAAVWQGVSDSESARAAADALLPVLERHLSALYPLLSATDAQRDAATAPHEAEAVEVNRACNRARVHMLENDWFGSYHLRALDYFFH